MKRGKSRHFQYQYLEPCGERTLNILYLKAFGGTLERIASIYDLSRSRVGQIITGSSRELKSAVRETPEPLFLLMRMSDIELRMMKECLEAICQQ